MWHTASVTDQPTQGQRVRQRREILGLSRAKAAALSNVGVTTWQRIEDDDDAYEPHPNTKARICEALGWEVGTYDDPVQVDQTLSTDELRQRLTEVENRLSRIEQALIARIASDAE